MAENSQIEWTNHTFNPWVGCTKVSPACDNCYAEEWDRRYNHGAHWGPKAPRRRTKTWGAPVKWNKEAAAAGVRYRVFCASLADVFDNQVPEEWRSDLWALIKATPSLDWLLLTKRPQNIQNMLPADWGGGWDNVWLGTTVENQTEANRRIPHLTEVPAAVRFLSCEPLLGPVDISPFLVPEFTGDLMNGPCKEHKALDWVITGGESGSHYRDSDPQWFRSLRDQCVAAGVAFLFKQWPGHSTAYIKTLGREIDGVVWDQYPISGAT